MTHGTCTINVVWQALLLDPNHQTIVISPDLSLPTVHHVQVEFQVLPSGEKYVVDQSRGGTSLWWWNAAKEEWEGVYDAPMLDLAARIYTAVMSRQKK